MMKLPQFSLRLLFFAIAVFAVSFAFERERWVKYSDQLAYEKYCKERIKLDASRGTISSEQYQADLSKINEEWWKQFPGRQPGDRPTR